MSHALRSFYEIWISSDYKTKQIMRLKNYSDTWLIKVWPSVWHLRKTITKLPFQCGATATIAMATESRNGTHKSMPVLCTFCAPSLNLPWAAGQLTSLMCPWYCLSLDSYYNFLLNIHRITKHSSTHSMLQSNFAFGSRTYWRGHPRSHLKLASSFWSFPMMVLRLVLQDSMLCSFGVPHASLLFHCFHLLGWH